MDDENVRRTCKYYDLFMRVFFPIGEKGRERIVERLSAGSILDVACGTGTLLAMAGEKGLECYGIDNLTFGDVV
jgi:2-polyprenyl-3-methyl-5-hydroxy-6-metoxy-1,4-benzoquinol methylase